MSATSTSRACAAWPSGTSSQVKYASSCVAYGCPSVSSSSRASASSSIPRSPSCEPCAHERPELVLVDPAELDLLRAPPEGLVPVVEDRREHVAPAPQVDVADLALGLEDRPHDVRERVVDADDLLELVEDEHDTPVALRRDLGRELQQSLDRRVDVRRAADRLEREPDAAVTGVELDRRPHAEAADDGARALEEALHGGEEVVDDRLRETGGEPHLRRRPHQVAVRDEHLVGGAPPASREGRATSSRSGAARAPRRPGRCACPPSAR